MTDGSKDRFSESCRESTATGTIPHERGADRLLRWSLRNKRKCRDPFDFPKHRKRESNNAPKSLSARDEVQSVSDESERLDQDDEVDQAGMAGRRNWVEQRRARQSWKQALRRA